MQTLDGGGGEAGQRRPDRTGTAGAGLAQAPGQDDLLELLAESPTLTFKLALVGERRIPVWVSPNSERILGFPPAETLPETWWWTHLFEQDRPAVAQAQATLFEQGELQLEYRFCHKDGHLLWIRDRQRLLHDPHGQPCALIGSWDDITEAKLSWLVSRARQDLREMVFDAQPLERVLTAALEHIEYCFPESVAALLLAADGAPSPLRCLAPALDETRRRALEQAARTNAAALAGTDPVDLASAPAACPLHPLAQAAGFVHGRYYPLCGSSPRPLGLLAIHAAAPGIATDSLLRRLSEFAQMIALLIERVRLDALQRQSAAVLASMRDAVFVADLQRHLVAVNPAWSRLTGHDEQDSLGRPLAGLLPLVSEPGEPLPWPSAQAWQGWQGEVRLGHADGDTFPARLSLSTVTDRHGRPTHYAGLIADLSALRQIEQTQHWQLHHDPLTELANRRQIVPHLEQALARAGAARQGLGVLHLDLDHFKRINDSLGHLSGDEALLETARRLQHTLTDGAVLARLGDDEFLILLEALTDPGQAEAVAQALLDALHPPCLLADGHTVYLGASIGISLFPADGRCPHTLLRNADTALHEAKARGRNRYCLYKADLSEGIRQHLQLEDLLRHALARGELSLHYQPQVDIRTGQISGVEALMRWHSPQLGAVSPARFIPVAEQSTLILTLGNWALEEACRQARQWQAAGLPALRVAVNVSVRQFRDPHLARTVRTALETSGLSPQHLEIELTESALVEDVEAAGQTCRQLRALGVKLSLDDFGTGYSSLAYLSRFPFDKIKIDQSFVRDLTSNPTNAAIARATIALAESLDMSVLAEGVETESQLSFLREKGCSAIQGYLFSKPLPPQALAALLREGRGLPIPDDDPRPARTLLLLDDEPNILRALQRLLRRDGYHILATTDPAEAFDLLARHRVQVVIADQRMPSMSGTEFLARVKAIYPDTLRMVLSGYSEVDTITASINRGAIYKYFTKPWDDQVLRDAIAQAFRLKESLRQGTAAPAPE